MMQIRPACAAAVLFILAAIPACGPAELGTDEQRPDLASIGGKADELPAWMRPATETLGCGDTIVGEFVGEDSAHLFRVRPEPERLVRLEFGGSYPWHSGAALAVYRSADGQLEQLLRNPWDSRVQLLHAPADGRDLLVLAYSLTWTATGAYQLAVSCPARTSPGPVR